MVNNNSKKRTKLQWREAVAGACSGAISRTILAPIERIKLLQQLQATASMSIKNDLKNLSAYRIAYKIYYEEGILSFWRGNLPNVIRVAGTQALNFTCMDYYKRAAVAPIIEQLILHPISSSPTSSSNSESLLSSYHIRQQHLLIERRRQLLTSFISGGLAGATATTVLYPIEFVRTRLAMDRGKDDHLPFKNKSNQYDTKISPNNKSTYIRTTSSSRQYTGMIDVIKSIVKSDGIFGFYQGFGVAIIGGIVYRVLHLGGYDACKTELLYRKNRAFEHEQHHHHMQQQKKQQLSQDLVSKTELSWGERFIIAQLISILAGTITYPFDSIRRRMMMQAGLSLNERMYINSLHCTRLIWNIEGIRGFYLGIGPNLVRSFGGALILVGYDGIRTLI